MTRSLSSMALAAAALACLPAAAQPTVSVYGLLDVSIGRFQNAGEERHGQVQSGHMTTSFLGFKGAEELSPTLKAIYAAETFLRADTGEAGRFGGDAFWARAAWVGLQGDFGSTVLGRTPNQFFVSTLMFNAFGDAFGYSPAIRQVLTPNAVHPEMLAFLGDTAWNNSLLYSSGPGDSGWSFNLQGALGERTAGSSGNSAGVNVLYDKGPWAATVAYQRVRHGIGAATPAIQSTGFRSQGAAQLGLSYDLGLVKLYGQYSRIKTRAAADTRSKVYGFGASAPLGAGRLLAQWGHAIADFGTNEVVNKTVTMGYDYQFSKSTDVYALVMNDRLNGVTPARANGNSLALGLKLRF